MIFARQLLGVMRGGDRRATLVRARMLFHHNGARE